MWVERILALQSGFVHPSDSDSESIVRAANAVFEKLVPSVALISLARIIPCADRVDIISDEVAIVYNEGITGSHFAVGGMDQIIIPLQVSSDIVELLRLSTTAFRVHSNLIWSSISVPSAYSVRLRASWACDRRMSVLFPHSFWIES